MTCLSVLAGLAWSTATAAPVVFGPLEAASNPKAPGVLEVVHQVTLDGKPGAIDFHPLLITGETYGDAVYGKLIDATGKPMAEDPDDLDFCNVTDFGALITVDSQLFHLGHMECTLGGITVSPLSQSATGELTAQKSWQADLSAIHGTHVNCAGDVTPWNTFLSSEEYDVDARLGLPNGRVADSVMTMETKHPFEWSFHNHHDRYQKQLSPYYWGWIPELKVLNAKGETQATKHYAMGRFSHELGLAVNRRTVYLSDDQYHAGFYMFVADKDDDLSAGTLYASRWNQKGEAFDIDWVNLGHATDAEIAKGLTSQFTDLFEVGDPKNCTGTLATSTWGTECLTAKQPLLASRLETRRYGAMKGATTELSKNEGLAFDPKNKVLYLAASAINRGMLDEQSAPTKGYERAPEADHVRLAENSCGIVYAFEGGKAVDSEGKPIASDWVARSASPAVVGIPEGDACSESGISNPDNLTFLDDLGLLAIAEDTGRHEADTLWVWSKETGLTPILKVHRDSEVSGIHWFGDVGGFGYLTVGNQWDDSDYPDHRSVTGVIGPFPMK